mgnify:CR=1 FL=1
MSQKGNYTNEKFMNEAKLKKLEEQGINVESLKKSIKQKQDDYGRRISK